MGLVTWLSYSALGALKHHYIIKIICELLNGYSRFLIQNLLNQLLCYADIKESWLFVAETVETLDLKIYGRLDGLATVFSRLDRF